MELEGPETLGNGRVLRTGEAFASMGNFAILARLPGHHSILAKLPYWRHTGEGFASMEKILILLYNVLSPLHTGEKSPRLGGGRKKGPGKQLIKIMG
jgi:hypothetical protein